MANLPSAADKDEERQFWTGFWPGMIESHGRLTDVAYVGSSRVARANGDSVLQVRVLARFEHGLQYLTADKVAGGRWYPNPTYRAALPPGGFRFIQTAPDAFLTRTFPTQTNSVLTFSRKDGTITSVRMSMAVTRQRRRHAPWDATSEPSLSTPRRSSRHLATAAVTGFSRWRLPAFVRRCYS